MQDNIEREAGIQRLTYQSISVSNQHYIGTYFIKEDIENAVEYATGKLLDIGCGNKPYYLLFKDKVTEYVGCDIVQSSDNIVDFICPANDLPFADNSFNTVFSTQVLEHVEDHNSMVKEAYRVLANDGYAIFTAPFAWELHEEPYDFFRFSKHGLKYLFEKHGFTIVSIKSNGGKWAAIFQLFLNVLMSTRKYGTVRSKIIEWIFIKFRLIILYNKFSIWLDKRFFDEGLTLNYIVIAQKRKV